MKHILFVLFSVVFISVKAQTPSTSIVVFAQDGEKFWLVLDGVRQNDNPQANVKVSELTQEAYRLKIIFEDPKIKSIDQNIATRWGVEGVPVDVNYVIRRNKKKYVLRVSNVTELQPTQPAPVQSQTSSPNNIPQNSRNNAETATPTQTPTQNSSGTVNTTVNTTQGAGTGGVTVNTNTNLPGINMNVNIQDPVMGENITMNVNTTGLNTTSTTQTTTVSGSNGNGGNVQTAAPSVAPAAPKPCTTPMSTQDFNNAANSIRNQSFAETQFNTARQITRNNCLSVAQVREIMKIFSFEANKLDFAKFAYDFTTDKRNYFMVSDEFSFSSSVDELNSFLEKK
jgi:hypothetical protein